VTDNQPKRQRYDHELLGSDFAHNAEQAVIPEAKPQNIVTPCHGMPLWISYRAGEPEEILCSHEGCLNSWNLDGTVEHWQATE
jgi:hypothetical protein